MNRPRLANKPRAPTATGGRSPLGAYRPGLHASVLAGQGHPRRHFATAAGPDREVKEHNMSSIQQRNLISTAAAAEHHQRS
jgi:hypothetical protein